MGLKKYNYELKNLGHTLPEAYALIKDIQIMGRIGHATIIIQSSRENAEKVIDGALQPYEIISVDFKVDRETNDRETVYNQVKGVTKQNKYIPSIGKFDTVEIKGPLYGWEDDK